MPAVDNDGPGSAGRRPKAWFGGNRGEGYVTQHFQSVSQRAAVFSYVARLWYFYLLTNDSLARCDEQLAQTLIHIIFSPAAPPPGVLCQSSLVLFGSVTGGIGACAAAPWSGNNRETKHFGSIPKPTAASSLHGPSYRSRFLKSLHRLVITAIPHQTCSESHTRPSGRRWAEGSPRPRAGASRRASQGTPQPPAQATLD